MGPCLSTGTVSSKRTLAAVREAAALFIELFRDLNALVPPPGSIWPATIAARSHISRSLSLPTAACVALQKGAAIGSRNTFA